MRRSSWTKASCCLANQEQVVTADPRDNKVYLAQKGNNKQLIVIDTTSHTVAASIHGIMVGTGITRLTPYN